ncbi:iron chaperone [Streptomyces sp. NPDC050523]|uniref:iron chaperone n=1 Tax=Streptomyces sp. NPDC050523 TaxID=3365622 RepID=UPI00379E572A
MAQARKAAASSTATARKSEGFTPEERAAMKERAKEVRASARRTSRADKAAEDEAAVLAKIAEMQDSDRVMAERIHAVVKASAPHLAPKLWYGMPAYAKDGKVVCFFQSARKFNARYATFGFNDSAHLDDGTMWPTAFALTEVTAAGEERIAALVERAAG